MANDGFVCVLLTLVCLTCQVRLLKERMQQPEQVLKQLDEVGATIQQLNVQGASSAKLAEQLVPHISHLEQLVVAPGGPHPPGLIVDATSVHSQTRPEKFVSPWVQLSCH